MVTNKRNHHTTKITQLFLSFTQDVRVPQRKLPRQGSGRRSGRPQNAVRRTVSQVRAPTRLRLREKGCTSFSWLQQGFAWPIIKSSVQTYSRRSTTCSEATQDGRATRRCGSTISGACRCAGRRRRSCWPSAAS